MNKEELVLKVSEKLNISKSVVKTVLDEAIENVVSSLQAGDVVSIPGFGKFEVKEKKAREVIIPKTDIVVKVPGHKTVGFRESELLKSKVQ